MHNHTTLLPILLSSLGLLLCTACEPGAREETRLFQEAEALYLAGDYTSATARYEEFLQAWPRSPFIRTAELRLRTIQREQQAAMETRATNRPIYIQPTEEQTRAILQEALGSADDPQPKPTPKNTPKPTSKPKPNPPNTP